MKYMGNEPVPARSGTQAALSQLSEVNDAAPRVLLVDDQPGLILKQVSHIFGPQGVQIDVARSGSDGINHVQRASPDVVLLDGSLPDLARLEVYHRIRQIDARVPVVFLTATGSAKSAIEAMRHGAFEYLFKPLDVERLEEVITQALELGRLMRKPAFKNQAAKSAPENVCGDAIVGCCPAMAEVYKAIGRVADQNVMVLINGESGTGKELVARAIYEHSSRSSKPFLAINCAAIPESLLESELFGHEKGAFTGADRDASANSSSATAERSSLTRSATCRWPHRAKSFGSCRTRNSSASAETRRSRPTCA